jgi:hypothetical protein
MANAQKNEPDGVKDLGANLEWACKFPKLAELSDGIPSATSYEGWFANLPEKAVRSVLSREWFMRLESDLAVLNPQAWESFKGKILNQINSSRRELISLFNEAAGYLRLMDMLPLDPVVGALVGAAMSIPDALSTLGSIPWPTATPTPTPAPTPAPSPTSDDDGSSDD